MSVLIEHHVLQHRAEAQRLEDLRLVFRRKIDRLGVAAAFDVEDAVVAPAMLVVADEVAFRIGGERRLAGAATGRTAATSAPVFLSAVAEQCIESTPRFGREVVHDREHAFLHFAGVLGAEDDQLPVFEAQVDARLGRHAGGEPVGGKRAGVVDDEVGLAEVRQLLASSAG